VYLVSMLFADLLSLHPVTFLMFFYSCIYVQWRVIGTAGHDALLALFPSHLWLRSLDHIRDLWTIRRSGRRPGISFTSSNRKVDSIMTCGLGFSNYGNVPMHVTARSCEHYWEVHELTTTGRGAELFCATLSQWLFDAWARCHTETESTYVMIESTLRFDDVEDISGLLPLLQMVQRSRMQSREQSRSLCVYTQLRFAYTNVLFTRHKSNWSMLYITEPNRTMLGTVSACVKRVSCNCANILTKVW